MTINSLKCENIDVRVANCYFDCHVSVDFITVFQSAVIIGG